MLRTGRRIQGHNYRSAGDKECQSRYCQRQHGQLENIVLKLNTTKSIMPECLAVKPEKFDKMICAKISAWEKFGGYISSKDELDKIRRICQDNKWKEGDK